MNEFENNYAEPENEAQNYPETTENVEVPQSENVEYQAEPQITEEIPQPPVSVEETVVQEPAGFPQTENNYVQNNQPFNNSVPPVNEPFMQTPPMGNAGYAKNNFNQPQQPYNQPYNQYGQMPPYFQQASTYPMYSNIPRTFPENYAANPVRYTPVQKNEDSSASRKGFKIFCVIIAAVILLTGGCVGGYFVGKNDNSAKNLFSNNVKVDLTSKPKDTDEFTAAEVYEAVNESIVGIRVYNTQGKMADASGVIYTEDGYVITNDHIYSEVGAPKFKIYMHDGTQYDADYVAGDVVSDLAVLKIRDVKNLKSATLGNSDEIYCGERVAAVGRPNDATARSTITTGIISLTARRVQTTSSYSARLIQTDSAINPGSSGGALVNMYGQVIGITASKLSGEDLDLIGFAIPTTTVKRVVEQLIKSGEVTDRAKLGISYTMVDSVTAEINNLAGVGLYVSEVTEDSDLHGKIGKGDIITHVNDIAITEDDIILDIIEACRAGDTITVSVITEKGEEKEFKAELKANIGSSSYSEKIIEENSQDESFGGTFDFPFGE